MTATGTMIQEVMKCPVCQASISGRFSYTVELSDDDSWNEDGGLFVAATVQMTGLELGHNCIPSTPRKGKIGEEVGP